MASPHTTDTEIVLALRALEAHNGSVAAAARQLGLNRETVRKFRDLAGARGLTAASSIRTEEDRLREEVRRLRLDVTRLSKEDDTANEIRQRAFALAARVPEPHVWNAKPHVSAGAKEIPILFASDWHWGEVVNPVEVAGVNAFNATVAAQRAELFFDTAIALTLRDGGAEEMVLCLGGDMITGTIHDELAETNDRTTTQSVNDVTDILVAGIAKLADAFKRIRVYAVVGNHGRNTMRPRYKQKVWTSYEWLIYTNLERHFRADERITFDIPGEADAFFAVNGKRFLLTHGDTLGVKGGDGIIGAIGPIMRGTVKLGVSEAQVGRDFDYLMMGHWHYPLYLPKTIVNGALKGYDEYARLALRVPFAPASQMLFRVHPEFGLTSRREIVLQEPWH